MTVKLATRQLLGARYSQSYRVVSYNNIGLQYFYSAYKYLQNSPEIQRRSSVID